MAKSPQNTEKMPIHLNSFQGGEAVDYKYGISNSFYSSQGLDFRQKASQMSVLPGMRQVSNSMDDLLLCMVQDPAGNRYGVGDAGNIYRVNTSGTLSTIGILDSGGAGGMAYYQPSDQIYMTSQQTVSMYGQTQSSSGPISRVAQFAKSASTSPGVVNLFNNADNSYDGTARNNSQQLPYGITSPSQVTDNTANVYSISHTGIHEDSSDLCYFAPDIEPFYSIAVYFASIGTGDVTLTLHDSLNNQLAQVTILNANLLKGWNEFVFPVPGVRAIPSGVAPSGDSGTYHFHLTASASGTISHVGTINSEDLSSVDFLLFAYRMVQTNNKWHPMAIFSGLLCIGNGPYVSTYDFSNDAAPNNGQYQRHAVLLDPGYEVCGLSVNNQYLVIAAEKRSTSGSHSYQEGALYFWDGSNQTPNFKIQISMGAPYSVFTFNNITYFYCAGSLFAWGGGQQVIKVRYISYQNTDYLGSADNTIVNPNMMAARYNLLMLGFPSMTTNANTLFGVYSWGAVELTYPNSFGYSYALSNGIQNYSTANNLKIGMIENFVDTMYTSWVYTDTNGTHYGMDILDNFSTPASNFSWQSLIYDGGVRYKKKRAERYKINFLPLPTNTTLTLQTNKDRGGWVNGPSANTGDTQIVLDLNENFHEFQWGFVGTSSPSATSPVTITGVTLEVDPLENEVDVTKDG